MKAFILSVIILIALVLSSCSDDKTDVGGSSSATGKSHNSGKNCLECHSFITAGTIYNKAISSEYSGAVVSLTSEANGEGTALASITSDKNGNFYTSSSVSFGSGIYVGVAGTSGSVRYMSEPISNGACNSCHNGTITTRIGAE
jgi:hypothetical protein